MHGRCMEGIQSAQLVVRWLLLLSSRHERIGTSESQILPEDIILLLKNPNRKGVRAHRNIDIILVRAAPLFSFVLEDHAITNTKIPAA